MPLWLPPSSSVRSPSIAGVIGSAPSPHEQKTVNRPYSGVEDTVREMKRALLGPRGAQSAKVRELAEWICEMISPKDYLSEILAIRHFWLARAPYMRDPLTVERVRDPEAIVDQVRASAAGVVRIDCDEITLACCACWMALGNDVNFITVGFDPPPAQESHVFGACIVPKTKPRARIIVDPVAGTREASMLTKVKQYRVISLG